MKRNVWSSPFGLAFIIGSLAALVAGYFTGAGLRGSETNMVVANYNVAADNLAETYPDENALVAANREPPAAAAAPAPSPPPAAAPAANAATETEAGPPVEEEPGFSDRPRRWRDRRDSEPAPDEPEDNVYAPQP